MAQDGMPARPPVTDWVTDWDHLDPRWSNDPYPIWKDMRSKCPVATTQRFEGAVMPTTYEAVKAIAYDSKHFSSRRVIVRDKKIEPPSPAPPITTDPPFHKPLKQVLLPPFTAEEMEKLEPKARKVCSDLIDTFIGDDVVDAAQQYARHIPVRVIAHMLGVPVSDGDLFVHWIHELLEVGIYSNDAVLKTSEEMKAYITELLVRRKADPGDDLVSMILASKIGGKPIPEELVVGMVQLLMIAGIDTTWSAIGASLWHLARTPGDRDRLIAEPSLMPTAIEELLRAFAPVTMARETIADTVVAGCPVKKGQMVLLSFPSANRDPAMFPNADKVVIDRKENRHAAFGLGIHRCVGSNLARMEMQVALEEWLKRIPRFSIKSGADVKWSEGTVRGPRQLPIVIEARG